MRDSSCSFFSTARHTDSFAAEDLSIEVWCDWNPAESELEDIAQAMGVGDALGTKRGVVAVVGRPQDIEKEEAMSFFGGSRAMRTRVRGRFK